MLSINRRKLSIITGKGKEGTCCCYNVNLPDEGEMENKAMQHIAWRNTDSFFRDSFWLCSKCSHDKAM